MKARRVAPPPATPVERMGRAVAAFVRHWDRCSPAQWDEVAQAVARAQACRADGDGDGLAAEADRVDRLVQTMLGGKVDGP